jgi:hypothetical protein
MNSSSTSTLVFRYLAIDVLFFRALALAGMGLPSRCLATGIYVTIYYAFSGIYRRGAASNP